MRKLIQIGGDTEAVVYDIGGGICYKWYPAYSPKHVRKIAEVAMIAGKHGLGPEVYEIFDTGYYTEIVTTIDSCTEDEYKLLCSDARFQLRDDLRELFDYEYEFFDLHIGNIGIKDGRLICIDFGVGTIERCYAPV